MSGSLQQIFRDEQHKFQQIPQTKASRRKRLSAINVDIFKATIISLLCMPRIQSAIWRHPLSWLEIHPCFHDLLAPGNQNHYSTHQLFSCYLKLNTSVHIIIRLDSFDKVNLKKGVLTLIHMNSSFHLFHHHLDLKMASIQTAGSNIFTYHEATTHGAAPRSPSAPRDRS